MINLNVLSLPVIRCRRRRRAWTRGWPRTRLSPDVLFPSWFPAACYLRERFIDILEMCKCCTINPPGGRTAFLLLTVSQQLEPAAVQRAWLTRLESDAQPLPVPARFRRTTGNCSSLKTINNAERRKKAKLDATTHFFAPHETVHHEECGRCHL